MKVVYLKDRGSRPNYIKKTQEFMGYDLGSLLIADLDRALSEPLDRPEFADMPEETRTRIRETY